jgi:hypothetical protein
MYLQKVLSRKTFFFNIFFIFLKVNDENSRDPDPLVRGMDPRIRIHSKMSWIRNTGCGLVASVADSDSVGSEDPN